MKRAVAVFAIVALFVGFAGADATAGGEHAVNDFVAAPTRNLGIRSADAQHHARVIPLLSALATLAPLTLFLASVLLRCGRVPLIGPRRRRIGDVGDDWRALLLGAPPLPL
jgi:hypothetical protein